MQQYCLHILTYILLYNTLQYTYYISPPYEPYTSELPAAFASSGGFSNYYEQPSYQQSTVDNWLKTYGHLHTSKGWYNPKGRAFPDVAAIGYNYALVSADVYNANDTNPFLLQIYGVCRYHSLYTLI